MTLKEKQLEFIIYCIENTAERLGRYSADVYNKLKELGDHEYPAGDTGSGRSVGRIYR